MAASLKHRRAWLGIGWLLVLAVIYLSLVPNPPQPDFTDSDKLGHLLAYAGLMGWWHQLDRNAYRPALLFVLMGLILEILQSFTDYRQGDLLDLAADALGVGLGWLSGRLAPAWLIRLDQRLAT